LSYTVRERGLAGSKHSAAKWVEEDMNILGFFGRARQLFDVPRMARLLMRLYRDGRVPGWLKLAGVAGAVLIISPLDLFSDIPLLGPIDDIALLYMLAQMFIGMCPPGIVEELGGRGAIIQDVTTSRVVKNVTPPQAS
jgi:uncharacterized membrane protein YkvA (DUF1232 family)